MAVDYKSQAFEIPELVDFEGSHDDDAGDAVVKRGTSQDDADMQRLGKRQQLNVGGILHRTCE